MKKLTSLVLTGVLSMATLLAGCSTQTSPSASSTAPTQSEEKKDMPKFVTVAGATSGGTYFLIANAMSQLFNEKIPGMNATAQSTSGTPKILETLNGGEAELGLAQAGIAENAVNGKGQFERKQMDNIAGVTFLYPNVVQFVVRKDAGIKQPEDLKGKKLAVGAVGSAVEVNSKDLFEGLKFNYPNDITPEYVSEAQAADLLKNKQVIGANLASALGSSAMLDIMSSGDFELLPISEEIVQTLHKEINVAYYPIVIPANTYPNQPEPVPSIAVANWLVARADVSEDFIYETLKVIYENQEHLVNAHKVMEHTKLESALNGQTVPLHPGAVKFYKDKGIDVK